MYKDISAEQACLGCCLLDADALMIAFESLAVSDFYKDDHKTIYKIMLETVGESGGMDLIILTHALQEKKLLEEIGGIVYLTHLVNSVPTVANIQHYVNLVFKCSQNMKIWEIIGKVKSNKMTLDKAVDKIQGMPLSDVKEETLQMLLEKTLSDVVKGTEFAFGVDSLNKHIGGLDTGELLTIGGWTSQCKSVMGMQMAINQCKQEKRVLFLSTEMTPQEVSRRLLGNLEMIPIMRIRKNQLTDEEHNRLKLRAKEISSTWELNIKKVFSMDDTKKYVRKYNPDFLVFDYLQNLGDQDYMSTSQNILELQRLTLQNSLGTVCLSQFNRNNEEVREPRLSDLRQSGRIEEVSNIVLLLFWEDQLRRINTERFGGEEPTEIKILISKNRDGTLGRIGANLYPEYARIEHVPFVQYQPNLYGERSDV